MTEEQEPISVYELQFVSQCSKNCVVPFTENFVLQSHWNSCQYTGNS